MPPEATLLAKELTKRFGTTVALDGVSLAVRRTECMALIGESGSGKTTLLRCFNRMTDPDSGRVLVDGHDATDVFTREHVRMALVFQSSARPTRKY